MTLRPRTTALLAAAALAAAGTLAAAPTQGASAEPPARGLGAKRATSIGFGGAVSTVDPNATRVGLRVLKQGGNAVDAAIATAGALGVTEPYSSGLGGGGYFVFYNAAKGKVQTIDGRETAPAAMLPDAFID